MGTCEHANRGEGEAENQEILIRAKVDFMFNGRGERKILGAPGKKHGIFWDSEKSWEQSRGEGPHVSRIWPEKIINDLVCFRSRLIPFHHLDFVLVHPVKSSSEKKLVQK